MYIEYGQCTTCCNMYTAMLRGIPGGLRRMRKVRSVATTTMIATSSCPHVCPLGTLTYRPFIYDDYVRLRSKGPDSGNPAKLRRTSRAMHLAIIERWRRWFAAIFACRNQIGVGFEEGVDDGHDLAANSPQDLVFSSVSLAAHPTCSATAPDDHRAPSIRYHHGWPSKP